MRGFLVSLAVGGLFAGPLGAQGPRREAPRFEVAVGGVAPAGPMAAGLGARRDGGTAVPLLVGAGILGGAAGLIGGAYAGALGGSFSCEDEGNPDACEAPVILGAVIGGIAGEALLLPLAEHLAGGRRGPFVTELLVSVGLAGLGLGLLEATHYDPPATPIILVGVPLAQLAAVTALERR